MSCVAVLELLAHLWSGYVFVHSYTISSGNQPSQQLFLHPFDLQMAHLIDITRAEDVIQYRFEERSHLALALQAPEKLHDKETKAVIHEHDGNRALAQLGQKVLETMLIDQWLNVGHTRGE